MIKNRTYTPRQIKVLASCTGEWILERNTKFVNIEEDIQGRDKLTFKCPLCSKQHTSIRVG